MRLLLATRNAHKIREISDMLRASGAPLECRSLQDFPAVPEVVEDEPTLEGNARKKALQTARSAGVWALADDTGLEVAALGGAPGVLSARYAGPGCDYAANNRKLLGELAGEFRREALFRTVMALASPEGKLIQEEGRLLGAIGARESGANGFGYDPVFLLPDGRTLAELSPAEKNAVSHRARAWERMLPHLKKLAAGLLGAAILVSPAFAGRTEPGQETIWDQIMAAQAHRGLRAGSRYLDSKEYDLAVKEFARAVAANPKDAAAHMMLGVAYYWNGQVDESLVSYRRSLELDPSSAQAAMLVGISLAWKGDIPGAHAAFKRAAELDGERADIQMNLGSIEETLGNVPEALERFRKAAALDAKNPLYHFQLGMLYRKLGRDPDAIDSFRLALKQFSEFEDALLELGAAEERRGDRKAARSSFHRAVALKSRDAVARYRLARLYLLDGDDEKARETLAEAFHLTPEEGGGGLRLSVSYAGGKKPAPAPAGGKLPFKPEPPPSDDPLEVFARNLERVPLDQSAVMQVDVAFVPRVKLVRAPAESPSGLKRALERQLAPERASPKAVRREYPLPAAGPAQRAARIQKALGELRALLAEAPPDADTRLGMNLTFTRLGDAGRAPAEGSSKVSYQPRQVGNDLGLWVIGTGWMALVEEMLPEGDAPPDHPDRSDWWVATGLAYATLGDGPRALAAFERACDLDGKDAAAFLGRAVASVMTGNEPRAVASLEQALRLSPKNKAAKDGLKWLLRPSAAAKER